MNSDFSGFYTHQKHLKRELSSLPSGASVLELGTGDGSAPIMYEFCKDNPDAKVQAFESDPDWFVQVSDKYGGLPNYTLTLIDTFDNLGELADEGYYDLVFVDQSPWSARIDAIDLLTPKCDLFILHDYDYFNCREWAGSHRTKDIYRSDHGSWIGKKFLDNFELEANHEQKPGTLILRGKPYRHNHAGIPGWFDFADLYSEQIRLADDMAHFVEVGTFYGKSASYMGVEVAKSNKKIFFDAIDLFEAGGDPTTPQIGDDSYEVCLENVSHVKDYVNVIKADSVSAASTYEDNSLDFVFIDAQHTKEATLRDLEAWYPKVKVGGTIAGHDYFPRRINSRSHRNRAGVVHAVVEFLIKYKLGDIIPTGWDHYKLACSERCFKLVKV